jgi:hypothetical protein
MKCAAAAARPVAEDQYLQRPVACCFSPSVWAHRHRRFITIWVMVMFRCPSVVVSVVVYIHTHFAVRTVFV